MEYIFVGTWKKTDINKPDYSLASIRISKNILISLIDVLKRTDFIKYSIQFHEDIKNLNQKLLNLNLNKKPNIYLDSGGYSVIVGDVPGNEINKFIDLYIDCLERYRNEYDYIFSLDIPILLNDKERNTIEKLTEFNYRSLIKSKNLLIKYEELKEKFLFVWQFKIIQQHQIWNNIVDQLDLYNHIKYHALGGMVGLRGITKINFSPFIGLLYNQLFKYISYSNDQYKFKSHCLGIYIQHDRFFLILLEKLFNYYLNRNDTDITYDSINYMRTAQLKSQTLEVYVFDEINDQVVIENHLNIENKILKDVYYTDILYDSIKIEIENIKNKRKLDDIDSFIPLNVYSNLQLDKFFEYIINKYKIVECFTDNPPYGIGTLLYLQETFFNIIIQKYPNVFTSTRITSLKENLKWVLKFNHWFKYNKTELELNNLLDDYVKSINFPFEIPSDSDLQKENNNKLDKIINNFANF